MSKNIYYDIKNDLEKYPNAWCIITYSKRGGGKTYSTLKYMKENKKIFVFMKRTNDDVDNMCEDVKNPLAVDLSPFKPLNRDLGCNVHLYSIKTGLGAFYECLQDENGKNTPTGAPIGYVLSANAVTKYKGYDLSECDYMIYDEFIPRPWERVNRHEGDQILDMYETISRDRVKRGRNELILIMLANATQIANPMFSILDLIDTASEMNIHGTEYNYIEDRGILLHQLPANFDVTEDTKKTGIQRAMANTQWGTMAYEGTFAYDDFSSIGRDRMKGYTPVCAILYKNKYSYVWIKDGVYYINRFKHNGRLYKMDNEAQREAFAFDVQIKLFNAIVSERAIFQSYTVYDLIFNFRKIYKRKG